MGEIAGILFNDVVYNPIPVENLHQDAMLGRQRILQFRAIF